MEKYKSKEYWIILLLTSLVIGTLGFEICNTIDDAITYHDIKSSTYQTPWHSNSWIKQPYTEFKLLGMASNIYWTINYTGSQRWLVKDTYIGYKVYWTILERETITK